jgi:5'-phosphate synthase pdxT subunit
MKGLLRQPPFGVLALQGDFEAHLQALRELGVEARAVRLRDQLDGLAGLVIPGGESTALLRLMRDVSGDDSAGRPDPWFAALRRFHAGGGVLFGTCAGAILLAREVRPTQPCLGLLDVAIARNAYGRQVDSFATTVEAPSLGGSLPAVFIRAPRFERLGAEVEVLASLDHEPVLVQQGRVLAATFHPELTPDRSVHRLAVRLAVRPDLGQASPRGAAA